MACMKALLIVVWSLPLLSVVGAGVISWRFLGIHESGMVEISAMLLAMLVMIAATVVALAVSGIAWATKHNAPA